ncbi:hypothetical protein G7K_5544-t1 [Saitoella complicata NRRL Y-17804]|uniref:Uncharacterized protein n=1 Tax=Saitoella complicata (strain BCRC 22490 / CBS 7301 / JCM 7358 / NBRC 10748 / NRRL Y-17804) TaxID=698492 RepID=A0A0E9NNS2_SAICN|nr:hypothetical protein G7K_5544-t1 [Saitoella complicata NRRL Y-17804]
MYRYRNPGPVRHDLTNPQPVHLTTLTGDSSPDFSGLGGSGTVSNSNRRFYRILPPSAELTRFRCCGHACCSAARGPDTPDVTNLLKSTKSRGAAT